jgi:gamma-glutamyltranspeptidase/glutathione hydrolase
VSGSAGVAVSVNVDATRLGIERLAHGGNAVDAAITMAFALAVTHPSAGNLGGGGFALVRLPSGETHALDFRESSPSSLELRRFYAMVRAGGEGPDSVGIPGSVAGLVALHKRFGQTSFAQLVEPARKLASEGHVISKREAKAIAVSWSKLQTSKVAKQLWGSREGAPLGPGTVLRLTALGETLGRIRDEGRKGFYEGPVAESLRSALGVNAQMSLTDLSQYEAKWRAPLRLPYRGLVVTTMPPPSAGGVALATSLRLLEGYDFSTIPRDSAQRAHLLLETMRRAQADRLFGVVDPDTLPQTQHELRLAQWLAPDRWQKLSPIDPERATKNDEVTNQATAWHESDQTTHLAVVDSTGMAVSLTTTLSSGFGSKVVTDSGIVLNNSLGSFSGMGVNQPGPHLRTTSSMAPTLVDDAHGLRLVLGTPGGDSIPSTLLQLINLLVDYGVPLDAAIDAPRLHQSVHPPGNARSEYRRPIAGSLRVALERMGHHFTTPTAYMGHANCIVLAEGVSYGYVDPREGGLALGLEKPSP